MISQKHAKKAKLNLYLLAGFFTILIILEIFFGFSFVFGNIDATINKNPKINNISNFNILKFWEREIQRVNITDPNIVYGQNLILNFENPYNLESYQFNATEIYFDSPNWVNSSPNVIKLHGYLIYPEKIKRLNPGCLCMHGLLGKAEDALILAKSYLDKGFIVLCHDLPGHGKSEGPEPTPNNFLYNGDYNQSAHFYLSLCGAIQGLKVLEGLANVNNSEIIVTGASYGGLNAMWLASICGERISGVIPYISIGDLTKNLDYPSKMIFWILGKSVDEISNSYLENQNLRFDPIYYLSSPKLPPILWQIGTNDDFFHYSSIKGTFDAVIHDDKFLQIFPNEHHGFPGFEDTTKFFINYVINETSRPPIINIINQNKQFEVIGNTLNVNVEINSSLEIDSVQICFNYIDIPGYCWRILSLTETNNNSWQLNLNPAILTSKIDYYFIIKLKKNNHIWFSSNIFSAGKMISSYNTPFIIILIIFIIVPLGFIIWRRYNKIISKVDKNSLRKVKKYFFLELTSISFIEFLFYLSLFLPWVVYESGNVVYSHFYIFNNLFTWKRLLGELSLILTILFFIGWILNSEFSFIKPEISGLLKIIYPSFILIIFVVLIISSGILDPNTLISNFGLTYPGIGLFLMLSASLATIVLGIWRKKYELRFGLRKQKPKVLIRIKTIFKVLKNKFLKLISKHN